MIPMVEFTQAVIHTGPSSLPTDGTEYYFYDGLDRKKQVTRADGSIGYTTYGGLDWDRVGEPRSSVPGLEWVFPCCIKDEAAKLRQSWTDGFGRLIEADEPYPSRGSLSSGSPCWHLLHLRLNNNLTGVNAGSANSKLLLTTMLSRLTAATDPESGTVRITTTRLRVVRSLQRGSLRRLPGAPMRGARQQPTLMMRSTA